jgi:hypothetical protein
MRRLMLAALVSYIATATAAAASSVRDAHACAHFPGERVVERTATALLSVSPTLRRFPNGINGTDLRPTSAAGRVWRACWLASGRTTELHLDRPSASPGEDAEVIVQTESTMFTFAGPYVAYIVTAVYGGGGGNAQILALADLRTGTRTDGDVDAALAPHVSGTIRQLAVGSQGFLAWRFDGLFPIDATPTGTASGIFVHDDHGTRLLDEAPLGALSGPSISGSTASWTDARVPRTATLG